jgi:putative transcriptional regulator
MARVRMTAEEIRAAASKDVDVAKVRATTEDEIRRHAIEDGEEPDADNASGHVVIPPALVRAKTGLTQDQFARALRIPVKTLRNWEQGRTRPDPAANALFVLVNADPPKMLALLGSPSKSSAAP